MLDLRKTLDVNMERKSYCQEEVWVESECCQAEKAAESSFCTAQTNPTFPKFRV